MKNENINTTNENVNGAVKIVVGMFCFLLTFYIVASLLSYEKKKNDDTLKPEVSVQYEKILAGQIEKFDGSYYVYVTFDTDQNKPLYDSYFENIKEKDKAKFYIVDTNDGFNKGYVADESKLNPENLKDIRFSNTTLIYVNNNKIIKTFEGKENIIQELEKINK